MIKCLRVDDRTIHGQVAIAWTKFLSSEVIMVCDDEIIKDQTVVVSLKMAGPPGVKVAVQSVDSAIKTLNDERSHKLNIFAITRDLQSCYRICQGATSQVARVNLGNYGCLDEAIKGGGMSDMSNKRQLVRQVHVTPDEIVLLRQIVALGVPVDVQTLPYMPYVSLEDSLK